MGYLRVIIVCHVSGVSTESSIGQKMYTLAIMP